MTPSILFGIIIVALLSVIVWTHGIPEKFYVIESREQEVFNDPFEFTRTNIKDYAKVFDGLEYGF